MATRSAAVTRLANKISVVQIPKRAIDKSWPSVISVDKELSLCIELRPFPIEGQHLRPLGHSQSLIGTNLVRSVNDDDLEVLSLVAVRVVALAEVAAGVLHLQVADGHDDGELVVGVVLRRLRHHLDAVLRERRFQGAAGPADGHDGRWQRVDGAHHGQLLADVTHDAGLSRAPDVRLVLDVNRPTPEDHRLDLKSMSTKA